MACIGGRFKLLANPKMMAMEKPRVLQTTLRLQSLSQPNPAIVSVDGDVETLLGCNAQALLRGDVAPFSLVHPDDHDIVSAIRACPLNAQPVLSNIRMRQLNGRIRCLVAQYATEPAASGAATTLLLRLQDARSLFKLEDAKGIDPSLRAMLENTNDFIFFKNRHHVITSASQTLAAITQSATRWTDLIGQTDYEVFPEAYADIYYRLEKQIYAGLPVAQEVQVFLTNAGQHGWVDNRKFPIHNPQGDIIGLFGIARDITEQKNAQDKQHDNEELLLTVINEIPDPIVLKDRHGNFLLGNRAVARLYNTTPEAMVGKHDGDFGVPQEMADFFRSNVLGIMARGKTEIVYEDSQDKVTGVIRHYRSVKKPYKNAQGENQILVVAQDITDLVEAQKHVTDSERTLQEVLTITNEGVWDWHVPTGKVSHNAQWFKLLSATPDAIPKTVDAFVELVHRDDLAMVRQRLDDMLNGRTEDYQSQHRLMRSDGQPIWVIDRGRVSERDAQGKPLRVIGSFTDITYQVEHQSQLEYIAHYDALTGLPNRILLADRLQQAMAQAQRQKQTLAVAYIDLDGFKAVNDHHGHDAGDRLLSTLASRMKGALREGDTLARLGGDEFVAVLIHLPDGDACVSMLTRLLIAAAEPVEDKGRVLQVSASLGVTFFPQIETLGPDQLLRQADQAMYQAKQAGKNRFHVFDADHDRSVRGHHEGREQVRRALHQNELLLHYQPKVNMRTGLVIGTEALIRWQHPERGLLLPSAFLPLVAGDALSIAIGEWVLNTAMTQIETWKAAGLRVPVSVNIDALHLQHPDFIPRLRNLLGHHPQVCAGDLELEVLETSALENLHQVATVILACKEMGVGFALDDFGTGYSSLSYLKHLPVGLLKVDQSFVRDMRDDPQDLAILEGVLGLARAFRCEAIGEGVESIASGQMLLRLGCELGQGYAIARPMLATALPDWLSQWCPDPLWLNQPPIRRDDLPILFASVEHRAWIAQVASYVRYEMNQVPPMDQHQCRFGQWLDQNARIKHGEYPELLAIELLHARIHRLANELVNLREEGQAELALARLDELYRLRDQLYELLMTMMK